MTRKKQLESITIVGAGVTGLAAAWKVQQLSPDTRITILESSNKVGGVLQTERIKDYLVETAADMFTSQPSTALELCREIGIDDQLLTTSEPKHKAYVGLKDQVVPVPQGFSLMVPSQEESIRQWPLLSESGKQRLLDEVNVAKRDYESEAIDEDFASFAVRRFGQEAFDVLIQPLVSGIYSADPKKLSMNATMQRFVEMEKEHGSLMRAVGKKSASSDSKASGARYNLFRTPREGFGGLISALVDRLAGVEIRTESNVREVSHSGSSKWTIQLDGSSIESDALIIAAPAKSAASMLPSFGSLQTELAGIESTSCAIVAMGIDRSELPEDFKGFGVIYPHIDGGSTIAISFASNKFAGRAPEGKLLLRFFIGGAMQESLVDLPDEKLVELALRQFEASFGCRPQREFEKVYRWKKTMPQYHVGHLDRVDRIESLAAKISGLELAGKSYRGVGIPACILSGFEAAERLFDFPVVKP
jgi:oxygen-dependent protoporphyrinogen oxidase